MELPLLLAVETSCDDTSMAVMRGASVLAQIVSSQLTHDFGGIVPELVSRSHQRYIVPVLREVLAKAGVSGGDLNLIAATRGPGLVGSIMVGLNFAKGLAAGYGIPLIGVNHIEAHLLAVFIEHPELEFPFIALIVSGGHTLLVEAQSLGRYHILGETRDDAAGECFDKVARWLGLLSPESQMGGPVIERLSRSGRADAFDFPRPMLRSEDYMFSFSGLKTAVMTAFKNQPETFIRQHLPDICASFQDAVTEVLAAKTMRAALAGGYRTVVLAGGVAANAALRRRLTEQTQTHGCTLIVPAPEYCTDNAAMVGIAGWLHFRNKIPSDSELFPNPSLRL